MITYNKEYGCWFQLTDDSRHYGLFEMMTYKHNSTSDILVVFDHDNDTIVNHVYGANVLSVDELDKIVTEYVQAYESKLKAEEKREAVVRYEFTRAGVSVFERDVLDDILERDICEWFTLNHAGREIRIPDTAMAYEGLEVFLKEAIDDWDLEGEQ